MSTKIEVDFSLALFNYILENARDLEDYNTIMNNITMWMR